MYRFLSISILTISLLAVSSLGFAEPGDVADLQKTNISAVAKNIKNFLNPDKLHLRSTVALVLDQDTDQVLFSRKDEKSMPIASITKLLTAMVLLDAKLNMDEPIEILSVDKDRKRWSRSRLRTGTVLNRNDLLELALMASENRAAYALARTYPGGVNAFIRAMNRKAQLIGMSNSHFVDPTGLDSENVASARDLSKMLDAAFD